MKDNTGRGAMRWLNRSQELLEVKRDFRNKQIELGQG
jgi:hypothetical protein